MQSITSRQAAALLFAIFAPCTSAGNSTDSHLASRYLPGDPGWPTHAEWNQLNETVGGRLIQGRPLARDCFGSSTLNDPVNVMSPYWLNDSCNPFLGPNGTCTLGNMASYAIDVADAGSVMAGIQFAQQKNLRLTIKNTGHDYLGRSAGEGSLALWTHNLKNISVLNYTSPHYTGPALKVGAGIEVAEAYAAAQQHGLRVVGGGCPTVGVAGGWLPGGGHGPLTAAYGLGADEALEYEVVTAAGQHLVVSPTSNYSDLYWALSGGGPGNYAVVLSITIQAHPDGPVAGLSLSFVNTDATTYWRAIAAWIQRLLEIDVHFPKLNSAATFTSAGFSLDFVTLPDVSSEAELTTAIGPFLHDLQQLNITVSTLETQLSPNYYAHYQYFTTSSTINTTNETVGNRLIPRSVARHHLPALIDTLQGISNNNSAAVFVIENNNVTHQNVGNQPGANAVLPAWRDSLFSLNFGVEIAPDASWEVIWAHQTEVNDWLDALRAVTPGGGSYQNEATFNDAEWKQDYFGVNYDRLAAIKAKYDPEYVFFANAAVGSDVRWRLAKDGSGRLYRR
ncbi:FAD-binding domain-containing protein [Aspergillus ibericus CBS 121593]|uniref:FAD-binding domain-containing protein n=1 Tax=Aspergillus ibericus CBS 121593 TaxID=1448316 RepID=A0A395HBQ1_9EURO|nr:FAD-binding domain-containing protein [Aspergillus ibericus CBS 121593]RAL04555.1 FAD-binding domain-containing protein [Aspergillus ibericus CBS 121593]